MRPESNHRDEHSADQAARHLLLFGQGAFYVATGVWPLVSLGSFQRVTGYKTDRWLVRTAGVLITAIGGTLLLAARHPSEEAEIPFLAAGSAAGLAGIDLTYVARRRIPPIYLLDFVAESVLLGCWAALLKRKRRRSESLPPAQSRV